MHQIAQRLLRHSFANGVKLLVSILVGFGLPSLIIHFVGLETYGAWALIVAISQFVYVADFGLQPALSKYTAEFNVKGAHDKISSLVTASLATYTGASIFLLTALFLSRQWIVPLLFKADPVELKSLSILLLFMTIVAMLNLMGGVFMAVLNGLQRMDISSYISTVGVILNFVVTVGLLALGLKLWALASGLAFSTTFTLILSYIYIRKLSLGFSISFTRLRLRSTWESLRGLLVLSSSDGTNRVVGALLGPGIRLLLGASAGLQAVGYYELASRLIAQLGMIPLLISTPLVPAVAELKARGAGEGVNDIVCRSLKYLNIFSLPFFIFLIIFARPILVAWLGNGYDLVAQGTQILAIGTYLNMLTAPAYHTLIGMGRPKLGVHFGLLNLILNTLVTFILILKYGFLGAVFGQTIALSAASCYFLFRFHRQQMLPFFNTHWNTFGKPCLFAIIISIPIWQIYRLVALILHWNNIFGLIGTYIVFVLLFVIILWYYKLLNRHDFELARSIIIGS